jgi:hypothetical protein
LTQLPAAGQLKGEARTQVAQLITNFNELITTQVQWRASYSKVAANLSALLGADSAGAGTMASAPAPTGTAGVSGSTTGSAEPGAAGAAGATAAAATAGAVGTSGSTTTELDPAIRAKLIELRTTLSEFEKASGGSSK